MAARQENSSKSLRILMAIGAPYVTSSCPSGSQDVGQKVMVDWLNVGGARGAEDRQDRKPMDFACQRRERGCAIPKELPRALDRLDVVHAAAIPLRAEPGCNSVRRDG